MSSKNVIDQLFDKAETYPSGKTSHVTTPAGDFDLADRLEEVIMATTLFRYDVSVRFGRTVYAKDMTELAMLTESMKHGLREFLYEDILAAYRECLPHLYARDFPKVASCLGRIYNICKGLDSHEQHD